MSEEIRKEITNYELGLYTKLELLTVIEKIIIDSSSQDNTGKGDLK